MLKILKSIDGFLEKTAVWLLIISVAAMLSITLLTIVLRWFQTSILWLDPLVRHLVFFSAFLGGVLATGFRKHIGIDIIGLYLEARKKHKIKIWLHRFTDIAVTFILIQMTRAGSDFMHMEMEFARPVFLGLKNYQLVGIMPLGFALMAFRFFNQFVFSFFPEQLSSKEGDE